MSAKNIVENAIDNHKIAIFSKTTCQYCRKTKYLFENEFPDEDTCVVELDELDNGGEIQNYLAERTGQRTVPNVFVNKKKVGGYDSTLAAFNSGKLRRLVNPES